MATNPEVTVLTAVRNGSGHLEETIACIEAQTFTDWEYIIVDDASTDNTPELVEEAIQRNPRIRLLRRKTSSGPYVAANDGLREAKGTWVVRIDADDLSPSNRIERQRAFLLENRRYRACVSYWQGFNHRGMMPKITPIPRTPGVFRWYLMLRSPSIHSAFCIERAAMEEIGGYGEFRLSQDYRLWCELSRRGWLGTIPEVLSYVRNHGERASYTTRELQRELALDVLSDHIQAMTGEHWFRPDIEALRDVGHSAVMPLGKGLKLLDRWDRMWQAASDLTDDDRAELGRLSAFRRWKYIRTNVRHHPADALFHLVRFGATRPRSIIPSMESIY
jgi:glycosyltransferase involved in cell wall biosynthesis